MASKAKVDPNQQSLWASLPDQRKPLIVPVESNWQPPKELPDLSRETDIAIDIETRDDSLAKDKGPGFYCYERTNPNTGYICGISVAWRDHSIYVPLRHYETACFDFNTVRNWINHLANQNHTRFIFHNFQYDWGWIEAVFRVPPPLLLDDTMAMAAMVDENLLSYSLDNLCSWFKVPGKDETLLNQALGKKGKSDLWRVPGRFVGPYAEQDAASTLALAQKIRPLLAAEELDEAYQIERDLLPLTLYMKQKGVRVDVNKATELSDKILGHCAEMLRDLSHELGETVSVHELRQNKWLAKTFLARGIRHGYTPVHKNPSFGKDTLANHESPIARTVHKIRHQTDLAEKFLQGYICEFAHKGKVYPTVNQFRSESGGARSHRFSYSDPPLQQMPSRDNEWAALIRSCFIPEDNETWCSIDYRQQEYRLIVYAAEMLGSRGAKEAADMYRHDPTTDFHDYVAALTKLPRKRAKDVNFATSYGAGVKKFALMTGMNEFEAQATLDQYNQRLPFVRDAYERYMNMANRDGYIRLIDGARGHFNLFEPQDFRDMDTSWYKERWPNHAEDMNTYSCHIEEARRRIGLFYHPWNGCRLRRAYTHKAFNRMIQGSAARQIKKAMVDINRAGFWPLLQIHDELCFSLANPDDAKKLAKIMEEAMPQITIPMLTDVELGPSWGDLKK